MIRARIALLLALVSGLLSSCYGTVGVVSDVDDGYYPPAAYVATTAPVYYDGYPTYWYGGRWYRRDHRGWQAYRQEPQHLREHRARGVPPRQLYGRGHGEGHHRW
jgi:hypothetical protein